ncbi:hypothetical protein ACWGJ6_02360 [Streptomyces canus]
MTDQQSSQNLAEMLADLETITVTFKAGLFYSHVQEILQKQREEQPGHSIGLIEIGHAAWRNLTPVEQAHTLDTLFTAYIMRVIDEDRERELNAAASSDTKTYLGPDDLPHLAECLAGVDVIDEDAQVEGVFADSLRNVLNEIDLLRHRVAMAKRDDT